jgi:hypothetical protein
MELRRLRTIGRRILRGREEDASGALNDIEGGERFRSKVGKAIFLIVGPNEFRHERWDGKGQPR